MFLCCLCKVHHRSCSSLFQHLKFHHGLYPGRSLRLKCGEPGYSSLFFFFFKKSVKNFKNITKTLAKKHQHQLAFHWESFYFKRFQFGPFNEVSTCTLEGNKLLTETWNVPTVSTTTWVKNYGTEYQVGMFVCSLLLKMKCLFLIRLAVLL
ncbi:putative protein arginine N-methyltransferase 3 [Labeo rohita]|uniref:C2H2-type domain-containing protein n=1 Tax=Labeo rohita TaxID=84645 RepID=A0ABQ8LTN4_LABRO|nr:putative protein arginine N-methyltransferase 3 [Labeo rohita]